MAWYTNSLVILRSLVGDDDSALYTDAKLKRILAIAGFRVRQEADFDVTYTVDLTSGSEDISPDPSTDYDFSNMIALKGAVILLTGELKLAGDQNITIWDGPSKIQVDKGKYLKGMLDWAKQEYEDYLKDFMAGNSRSGGAVMTPYTKQFIYPGYDDSYRCGSY
jgi:hypothetical protein